MHSNSILSNLVVPFLLSVLIISFSPCTVSFGAASVEFQAGTAAGWDFHKLETDIAKNNTVDWGDLGVIAQHWLAADCGVANQWCSGTDLDDSAGVDFIDYSLLIKDWSKQGAGDVLLQTIYGTAQDSAGNITANASHALSLNKGKAVVFVVPQNTAIDKGIFKCFGDPARTERIRIRLYNVTGKNYLSFSGHPVIQKSDPGSGGALLFDYMATRPNPTPSHSELGDGRAYFDMVINFGPMEVTAGQYLIVFDADGPDNTWASFVRSGSAAVSDTMGKYPDGSPLPKQATVTSSSSFTGNTYHYELSTNTDTTYTARSYLIPFQITTTIINYPPVVNAGTDQQIVYPVDTVNLSGTATDDGIPNPPGVLTTTWSKTSGPGNVTFGDANALNTTATFSTPGTYVLRLTANDSALSAYDEVTITYRQNEAPVVNAGTDKTVGIEDITTISGTVTDDGLPDPPNIVTKLWTQQSGPGTATFANPNALTTTVSFSATGTYVLQLTADDSELESYDEATVTVVTGSLNNPPVVSAGIDQEIILPGNASLDGTVTDDDQPNPPGQVTVTWTKTSGPGTVTFGNIHLVDTTANFSVDGVYVLRLTASDSSLSSYDEVTITVNPQGVMPQYYRLSAHFHTTNSDGLQSLDVMMSKYRDSAGTETRDAACVTDHDFISNGAASTTSTFLGINGVEASTGPHCVGFGMNGLGSVSYGSSLQQEIDNIRANGGLPCVAHPYWSYDYMGINILPMLENMTNCNIIAVYNGYCQVLWGNGNSEAYWDSLLSSGKHIWGVGEEDTHGWGNKCGFVCTMVDANAFTVEAIKDALSNGKMYFYNSANRWVPCMELAGYTVSGTTPGSTISVAVGGALVAPVTIQFIGNNGTILKTVTGTSGSYTITGTENYVRTKIKDSSVSTEGLAWPSTTIWMQPVWITP